MFDLIRAIIAFASPLCKFCDTLYLKSSADGEILDTDACPCGHLVFVEELKRMEKPVNQVPGEMTAVDVR